MQLVENLQHLNNNLITLNSSITALMQQMAPGVQSEYALQQKQSQLLTESSDLLKLERIKILALSEENDTYDGVSQEYSTTLASINTKLNFWMLFVLIIIAILIKTLVGGSTQINKSFWAIIWVLLFILTFNLNTLAGYLTWGILVLIITLMTLKLIPSP